MTRYVALLRAINVGRRIVKSERLRDLFTGMGHARVSTFIASGNVLFDSRARVASVLERGIERALAEGLGFDVPTYVRTAAEVVGIDAAIPFSARALAHPGSRLYVGFLKAPVTATAQASLLALCTPTDELAVVGREFYWLCRTQFRDSTVTGVAVERALGDATTMRNITTVRKLAALVLAH